VISDSRAGLTQLPEVLARPNPFISEELMLSTTPILFRLKSGAKTVGYDA
jgi:hypothetical protein